jgi:hypothetical protein
MTKDSEISHDQPAGGQQQADDGASARITRGQKPDQRGAGNAAQARADERKARAAQKLRENLARRKLQSRARRAGDADETNGLPAAKSDTPS